MSDRIKEASTILERLGMPKKHRNECAALTLLALCRVGPSTPWADAGAATLRTHEMMAFMRTSYGKHYEENTRETIRKEAIQPFEQGRLIDKNPDDPSRPINSPNTRYRLTPAALDLVRQFGRPKRFEESLARFHKEFPALVDVYAARRRSAEVVVPLGGVGDLRLSPGPHNELQRMIVQEFLPRFAPNAEVAYLGDTRDKAAHFKRELLIEQGFAIVDHGKLPDIVALDLQRRWVFLVEAVTTHGPISPKRLLALQPLIRSCPLGPVFVSAFPDRKTYRKYAADLAWETEAWIADEPDHLIHFNGDRFLGPH